MKIKVELKNSNNKLNNVMMFSYLTRLRQLCIDPSIVIEDYNEKSNKIKWVENMIEENITKHKILLFSQFTSVLKKIGKDLDEKHIKYFYLDGNTISKKRINMVNEFNENSEIRIFLISKDTIEEKIVKLKEDKKLLINEVITGKLKDENIINKFNKEEMLNIILG